VNVILNVLFAPGCIVPLPGFTVNLALLDVTLLITRGAVPVFVMDTLSGFPVAKATNPYEMVFRLTESAGTVPVPEALTVSGDVGPSCVKTIDDVCAPAIVGANVMPNFLAAPASTDALTGPTVNRALLDLTELIVSVVVPVFVTVTLSVFVLPICTLPIESFLELTEKAPASVALGKFSPASGTGEETVTPDVPVVRSSWACERRGENAIQSRKPIVGAVFM
jgi:hypothetical protein